VKVPTRSRDTLRGGTGTRAGAGGPGAPVAVELAIGGMTCAACAARVQKKLDRLDGVTARVSYATERASVASSGAVPVAVLIEEVEKAGYSAQLITRESGHDRAQEQARVKDLRRRLMVALVLGIPLCNLSLGWALVASVRVPGWQWILMVMAAPVVTWCAWPFHRAAWKNARHRSSSMDTLVSLGILTSAVWSVVVMFGGDPAATGEHASGWGLLLQPGGGLYLDVAAGVTTFLLVGRVYEAQAKRRAGGALRSLAALATRDVRVVDPDGGERLVPVERLQVGRRFAVRPGETVPTDGEVDEGTCSLDCSRMTGESAPVEVGPGAPVLGGTIVLDGRLVVRATRVGADTQLARMVHLVEEAQAGKAAVQRLADRISAVFVPVVLVLAVLTALGWLLADASTMRAVGAGIAVLIIACPCALGLATPTALMVASGVASEHGIYLRGLAALEAARAVDTVVLDKTGTVTTGRMQVVDVAAAPGTDPERVLAVAGALEASSEHGIAGAVAGHARAVLGTLPATEAFSSRAGFGVTGRVDGRDAAVGRPELLAEHGIEPGTGPGAWADGVRREWERAGRTVVLVGWDGAVRGLIAVTDTVKPSAAGAVATLQGLGLRVILLTGDNADVAAAVAAQLGIDEVIAGVLPAGKSEVVRRLQAEGRSVAMVGDGVNDGPALAVADLGLAIGTGTDVARGAADLILLRDHLDVVPLAIRLSRSTLRTIRGNLVWAFGYNVAALPLAASGLLNPLIGGAAMTLSSMFVLSNSLRLQSTYRDAP